MQYTGGYNLPSGLKRIEAEAFRDDLSLTGELIIPDGVESIGDYAFAGCKGLTGVPIIPDSVQEIGAHAFEGCSGLEGRLLFSHSLALSNDVFEGTALEVLVPISQSDLLYAFDDEGVTITGYQGNGENGAYVVIPQFIEGRQVIKIAADAFKYKGELKGQLVLPEGLKIIEDNAFDSAYGLTGDITIPDSVESIGSAAFVYCWGLTGNLHLPTNLKYLGEEAFQLCPFHGDLIIYDVIFSPNGEKTMDEWQEWIDGNLGRLGGKIYEEEIGIKSAMASSILSEFDLELMLKGSDSRYAYDIVGGVLNNKIKKVDGHFELDEVDYAHYAYWYYYDHHEGIYTSRIEEHLPIAELWGHYVGAQMSGNLSALGLMKEYFPETCRAMDQMAEDLWELVVSSNI